MLDKKKKAEHFDRFAAEFISFAGTKETNQRKCLPRQSSHTSDSFAGFSDSPIHGSVGKRRTSVCAALRVSMNGSDIVAGESTAQTIALLLTLSSNDEPVSIADPEGDGHGCPSFSDRARMVSRKIPGKRITDLALSGKAFFFGSFLLTLIKRNELGREAVETLLLSKLNIKISVERAVCGHP